MKTIKQLFILFLIIPGTVFLTSCNDDDVEFNAVGDVYVVKKEMNNEIVYAPTWYLYGNKSIASVTVTPPEGENSAFPLEMFSGSFLTFYKGYAESDFSTDELTTGGYIFDAVDSDGNTFQSTDIFGSSEINWPEVTEIKYDEDNGYIYLSWDLVTNADAYNVRLLNSEGELAYNGAALTSTSEEFLIMATDVRWVLSPVNNEEYKVELNAFLFDSEATDSDWNYNLQMIAVKDTVVTWNPS